MGSQGLRYRNGTRVFVGEEETEEIIPEQSFCKEIRKFKDYSRSFHEFYAQAEGAHNRRSFDRNQKGMLERVVLNACHYPNRYEGKKEWSESEKEECSGIVDEILSVSKRMVGNTGEANLEVVFLTMYQYSTKETSVVPLFKIYGNKCDFTFISKNRRQYDSLYSFVDNNDLPHCLVCAAREGSMKTYEIDPIIKKYPLVFFTVNYSKGIDRRSEHLRVYSTIWKNTIIFDLPFLLVQGFFQHIYVEVKYFTSNINYNQLTSNSMKYKFYKFMEERTSLIPMFGTLLNDVIIMSLTYLFGCGLATDKELEDGLLLNGNVPPIQGIGNLQPYITPASDLYILSRVLDLCANSFDSSLLGNEGCFKELKRQLKESKVGSETVKVCSDIIEELCILGEKFIDAYTFIVIDARTKFMPLLLKMMLRLVPWLSRYIKSEKPRNYVEERAGNKVPTTDDGDYSLKHFLEVTSKKSISELFPDEEKLKNLIERAYKECAADNSEFICLDSDKNAFISLAPTFAVIEKLLESLPKNARVRVSEDKSFYEISSEEAVYKIYPFKNDKLNLEIQYISVEIFKED